MYLFRERPNIIIAGSAISRLNQNGGIVLLNELIEFGIEFDANTDPIMMENVKLGLQVAAQISTVE